MELGSLAPLALVTSLLGRPPSREDLQWWEKLAVATVDSLTEWLGPGP
jgi:hypothetical protein